MDKSVIFIPDKLQSKPLLICGLMTGTSLDGIDAALAEFSSDVEGRHHFKIINYQTTPLPAELKSLARQIINGKICIRDYSLLNALLPLMYADAVKDICRITGFPTENLDAVGVHGQTVWHEPVQTEIACYKSGSTLQAGSVSALATLLNVPVVGDFRLADIALGGQGAPLVPIFDYEFLSSDIENVIALNIGGISNITVLKKGCQKHEVIAFDTGPGNVLIDILAQNLFGLDYDRNGEIASTGSVIPGITDRLKQVPFIRQKPPKSTGREMFNIDFINKIASNEHPATNIEHRTSNIEKRDLLNTFTYFTAWSIAENIRLFADEKSKIVVSGGGSDNLYLMELLVNELPGARIVKSDEIGIPSDAKEAICFAYLAYRTLNHLHGNIPNVTGATREAILGVVALP